MNEEDATARGPTSLVELIDGLVEPIQPAPIPLTPQTWGWPVLALLVLALVAVLLWRWRAWRRANAYRRVTLGALDRQVTGAEVAGILRRAALAAYPRADVASLTGADWLAFLDRTGRAALPAAAGAELIAAPYRAETAPASEALRIAAAAWVRRHARSDGRRPAPTAAPRSDRTVEGGAA
ncbi:MAG: DUF4381 domain-containing protein [Acuticoccus sp.]